MSNVLTHVSLFSGIGGFDLAAMCAGFRNCAHVEINEFCREILKLRFPDSKEFTDVTTVKGSDLVNAAGGHITVLSGGFPCQPVSIAGQRKGSEDERWMWNDYFRVIAESRPSWIIIENSARLLIIPEWGGVQSDLEGAGYEIRCFRVPAAGVGAPHVRERACIVAHTNSITGLQTDTGTDTIGEEGRTWNTLVRSVEQTGCCKEIPTDTMRIGLQENLCGQCRDSQREPVCLRCNPFGEPAHTNMPGNENPPTVTERTSGGLQKRERFRCGDWRQSFLPNWEAYPPAICRMDDGVPPRVDKPRLQALGNAVVPRVFFPFFRAIAGIERGEII